MGDMADFTIEQGMNEDDYRYDHPYEFEDENNDYSPVPKRFAPKLKVCQNCGMGGFHWYQTNNTGWRLFDKDNKIHNCNKKFAKGGKRIIYK